MATRTFYYEQGILPLYLRAPNPGIYVTWDRVATNGVSDYFVFRSDHFTTPDFPTIAGPGIGTGSTPDYTFNDPNKISFNTNGDLYVMDYDTTDNSTIVRLQRRGSNLFYLGSLNYLNIGFGTAQMQYANHFIDNNGTMFVSDINYFNVLFPAPTAFAFASGSATGLGSTMIDPNISGKYNYEFSGYKNELFVLQNNNSILHLRTNNLTSNSIELDYIETIHLGTTQPTAITVDTTGNIFLSGFQSGDTYYNDVFIMYSSKTGYSTTININVLTGYTQANGVAVDNAGMIYIADTGVDQMVKADKSGNQTRLGGYGQGYLQFNAPVAPAIDQNNNIYFCDAGNKRIQYFDGMFYYLATIAAPQNEVIDKTGSPSSYYYIKEVDQYNNTLNNIGPITGEELLIYASLSYEISSLLAVPIYDEEPLYSRDRAKARVAYDNICFSPAPEIRITSGSNDGFSDPMTLLDSNQPLYQTTGNEFNDIMDNNASDYVTPDYPNGLRYKMDYKGTIYFVDIYGNPVSLKPYDSVMVTYCVKLFTGADMNNALMLALNAINSQPGANKYNSLFQVPFYYDEALICGATYYLIRQLLLSLTQRERRLLIMDPDSNEKFDPASNLRDLMKEYHDDFDKFLEKLPIAEYPTIASISVPEYAMPGGRSRYFRYIWKGGQAG